MGKDSFILYDNYADQIEFLTDEQAGVLLKAIYAYRNGKPLPAMDSAVNMAFSFVRSQIDRDQERYDEICEKRRAAGATGGAPKGNQNAKKQPKQANAFDDNQNAKNNQNNQMQAKQPDNDNEHDNVHDIKEKSTYVLKKKSTETDGRSDEEIKREKAQAEFFALYPEIGIDNYSAADYAEIDFELLAQRFEESAFLRTRQSFSWICSNYRKIAAGEYKDFEKKKAPSPYSPPEKKNTLGAEWSDLEE